jgi:hypothetical protein
MSEDMFFLKRSRMMYMAFGQKEEPPQEIRISHFWLWLGLGEAVF